MGLSPARLPSSLPRGQPLKTATGPHDSPHQQLPSPGAAGSAGSAAWVGGWCRCHHSSAAPLVRTTSPGPRALPAAASLGPPPPPSSARPAAGHCQPHGHALWPPEPLAAKHRRPEIQGTMQEAARAGPLDSPMSPARPASPPTHSLSHLRGQAPPHSRTCFTCCQDSSHCLIFLLASSSCRRTRASSAPFGLALEEPVGPVFRMGDGLGEKLPETKSQMLPGTPFKPEYRGEGGDSLRRT